MILFPAIDLIAGQVVRLERGDRQRMKVYSHDPTEVAHAFARAGARWIHVVDLSATFEEDEDARAKNIQAIKEICAVEGISVDAGGGVRSLAAIERLVQAGVSRIALGTAIVRDPSFARAAVRTYGDMIVADVAAQDGIVRVNGWRESEKIKALDLVANLARSGFSHVVFTDIARDGMQCGIDVGAYERIAQAAGFPVVASGGISSLEDIRSLAAAAPGVIEGAIVGRALYEKNFSLEEALRAAQGDA
ncbi:MAG: HisA/HisF-related TIM barrel protein [Atopobiaceae bacterium]|jgi:phosphoribosylformimino-5-aminoimidazole carboxamide ribotide isomerase